MVKKNNPIWLIKNAQLDRCAQVALAKDIVKKASKNREDLKAANRFFFKKNYKLCLWIALIFHLLFKKYNNNND